MIDLNSDKIENPEDNTQENEEVENSSIKKRVIIGPVLLLCSLLVVSVVMLVTITNKHVVNIISRLKFCIQRLAIVLLPLWLILGY